MSKDWPYSKLTKKASEHGGPEQYIKKIATHNLEKGFSEGLKKGFQEGAKSKDPVIAAVGICVGAAVGGITYIVTRNKTKWDLEEQYTVNQEEAEIAHEELLREYEELEEENQRLMEELAKVSDEEDYELSFREDGD